jgi:hypothetical protein
VSGEIGPTCSVLCVVSYYGLHIIYCKSHARIFLIIQDVECMIGTRHITADKFSLVSHSFKKTLLSSL